MAQVQQLPPPGVELVALHHVALHLHAAGDDRLQLIPDVHLLQAAQQIAVAQHAVLDDLGAAVGEHGIGQTFDGFRVAEHQPRLVERAAEVLARGQVDGGLATDGGIHAGQQRGGHLNQAHAPQIGGCGEAGEVAHHAAAQGDQAVRAGEVALGEEVHQI